MIFSFVIVLVLLATLGECSNKKILCGRTGNGKSYIANLMGCDSQTCWDKSSCTQEIKSCPNGVIDTIGLDDDGKEHEVMLHGKKIKLSGYTYPVWALCEHLEANNIVDVEFYHVYDAGNMRVGATGKEFNEFLTNILSCPYDRIVNKFREDDKNHQKIDRKSSDVVVHYDQKNAVDLKGSQCSVHLPKNWRDLLVKGDLAGLKSQIKTEKCNSLRNRVNDLQSRISHTPDRTHDHNECKYWGEIGGRWCRGVKMFGKCSDWEPNRGWRTDPDCIRRKDQHNTQVDIDNKQKHELNRALEKEISEIKASMQREEECTV